MTIKKKIFLTNSCMVLLALVVLLLVGGGMLSLFKDELLGWYRDNSKIADQFETVYDRVPELFVDTTDWAKAAEELERYDYRLLVRSEDHKTVFENAKHSEEESAETLYEVKKNVGQVDCYLIEHTTIISLRCEADGKQYDCYVLNCPSDASIFGMDRGLFVYFNLSDGGCDCDCNYSGIEPAFDKGTDQKDHGACAGTRSGGTARDGRKFVRKDCIRCRR